MLHDQVVAGAPSIVRPQWQHVVRNIHDHAISFVRGCCAGKEHDMAVIGLLDDDPLQARLIIDNLQATGHAVVWARHSWEALLATRRTHPDLILVDCGAAQWLDFLLILRTIRGFDTTALVLLCVQYPPRYYLKKLGVACILPKPFSAAILVEHVCQALQGATSGAHSRAATVVPPHTDHRRSER